MTSLPRRRALLALLGTTALIVAACSSTQSPSTAIAASEVALTAADQLAIQYVTLPLCGPTAPKLCSSASISAQIKTQAQNAYNAIQAAKANPTSAAAAAAAAAVSELQALVPPATTTN
jgi:hypothetical protein